jgi:quercetin dioxygenase-like cupin family protein
MRHVICGCMAVSALMSGQAFAADPAAVAKPELVMRQTTEGMPTGKTQEIRVLTATIAPGAKTPLHSHRFPVTVHVLEGTFTLEMEGREPMTVKAGEAWVEPPNVKMTGSNRSSSEPIKVLIFYVSDPDTPFLDPVPE